MWEAWKEGETGIMRNGDTRTERYDHSTTVKMDDTFCLGNKEERWSCLPPNSLHHLVAGLMRYLHNSGRAINVFCDAQFSDFCASMDVEMKRFHVGSQKRQAEVITKQEEVITKQEEDMMWGKRTTWRCHPTESS